MNNTKNTAEMVSLHNRIVEITTEMNGLNPKNRKDNIRVLTLKQEFNKIQAQGTELLREVQ